jgi:hypothetical protein
VNAGEVSYRSLSIPYPVKRVYAVNELVFLLPDRDRFYDGCIYIYMVLADHHYHLPQ